MKRLIILLPSFIIFSTLSFAQSVWLYDFGTEIGTYLTAGSTILSTSIISGDAGIRVGDLGGGFIKNNIGDPSYTQLECFAAGIVSGTPTMIVNKFSIYNYSSPSTSYSMRFKIRFENSTGTDGRWYFFLGNYTTGNYFTNTSRWSDGVIHSGIKWVFDGTSNIQNYTLQFNDEATGWISQAWTISKSTEYIFEIFGNNSSSDVVYNYLGSPYNLPADSYDIWINGIYKLNQISTGTLLALDTYINAYMFLGETSTGNSAEIIIDDIFYSNGLVNSPLPVELSSFTATYIDKNINLNWRTETEVNNYGFEVERKVGNSSSSVSNPIETDFEKIGFVNGNGNSNSPKEYSFIDSNPPDADKYLYRLKQIDNDGKFEYSKVVEVSLMKPNEFILEQNYPNPFNPVTTIPYSLSTASNVKLTVFNILGEEISTLVNEFKEAGSHSANFNASLLNSGIYFYKLESTDNTQVRKMSLLK